MTDSGKPTVPGTPAALKRPGSGRMGQPPEFEPGHALGDYVLEELLAVGGCGTVYSARHRLLGRPAAIKVLHRELSTSPEMFERFVREARVVNQIRHPNIVDVYGFGEVDTGRPFLVMELLSGVGLQTMLERRHRLAPAEALLYLEPICAALRAAHEAGVVHRDLKANNVMVLAEGDSPRVKLLDFGIAKLVRPSPGDAQLTAVGQRLGTPTAMAPEQIRGGTIDARTDIYAL
ncbi:MAG: serine/threonine protein kinase, partial [Deltaproteobacteria bacterium]|nr:serine/threonine protein kinase [Deltaproteobacteria bacterium]